MSALLSQQRRMQLEVLQGGTDFVSAIQCSPPAEASRRASVYIEAYRLRLIEVLGNDYPTLKHAMGDAAFAALMPDYIDAHPSSTPSIRYFGRHLPAWLRTIPGISPAFVELAAFEWAQGEVFDAMDSDVALLEDVACVAPDNWPALNLLLRPSTRMLQLRGNAPMQFLAHSRDEEIPASQMRPATTPWLLWRRGYDVHWRALDADEAALMARVRNGASFGAVCEHLIDWVPADEAPLRAAGLLKRWLCDELLQRFEPES
ncbi:MAG TPA: DNA-binding domain-containing protein [Solimonas sp.]